LYFIQNQIVVCLNLALDKKYVLILISFFALVEADAERMTYELKDQGNHEPQRIFRR